MAALTITINESVRTFGPQQTDNWGTMLWGDAWGYGSKDAIKAVDHINADQAVTSTDTLVNSIAHVFSDSYSGMVDDLALISIGYGVTINESYSGYSDSLYDLEKIDANGYYYNFGDSSNAASTSSDKTDYSGLSNSSSTFTGVTTPTTTWTLQ